VPKELEGLWYDDPKATEVTLSGNTYTVKQPANHARGNVVVNGDEIDFFNGDGCAIPLPGGVGRYRWKLEGSSGVHYVPLNDDPCGRVELLDNISWSRTTSPQGITTPH
jgi:hypothetical protein